MTDRVSENLGFGPVLEVLCRNGFSQAAEGSSSFFPGIFDVFLKWSKLQALRNCEKTSNMPNFLAYNEIFCVQLAFKNPFFD